MSIKYIKCTELSDKQIYDAFMAGFADYMIQIKMEQDIFMSRFFGCEGNQRELSYVAYEGDNPVGVCFGGIKTDERLKTMRCGGMAVTPEVRGKGVAGTLLQMHKDKAKEIGCTQLFLEVIDGNDRAIAFYKKHGYEKVYNLTYRKLANDAVEKFTSKSDVYNIIESITYDEAMTLRQKDKSHLPWQSSFQYFKELEMKYFGIKQDGELVAGIATNDKKVSYLWVDDDYRLKGYAKALIHRVIKDLKPESLLFTYANSSSVHTFCNHLEMTIENISQLEMYQLI